MPYLSPHLDAPDPTESALIVPVPAAEALVGPYRERFDAAAGWGVPAHITVLYPFVEPSALDGRVTTVLDTIFRSATTFDCELTNARWFDTDVLWLEPEPAAPFLALTAAVVDAFPEWPPYRGVHDDVVPHLTVGERRLGELSVLQSVERSVRRGLPIKQRVAQVLLVAGTSEAKSWRTISQFELGGAVR